MRERAGVWVLVCLAAGCSKKTPDAETPAARFARLGGLEIELAVDPTETPCSRAAKRAEPAEEILRRRFEAFATPADIQRGADGRLILRLSEPEDRARRVAEHLLSPGGCLTLRLVDDEADPFAAAEVAAAVEAHNGAASADERVEAVVDRRRTRLRAKSPDPLRALVARLSDRGLLPADRVVGYELEPPNGTHATLLLHREAPLTGAAVQSASLGYDEFNRPTVSVTFDAEGARALETLTGENVRRRLAIALDDRVYSAPTVKEPVSGGRVSIMLDSWGADAVREAQALVSVLHQQPLRLKRVAERTVGPAAPR